MIPPYQLENIQGAESRTGHYLSLLFGLVYPEKPHIKQLSHRKQVTTYCKESPSA